MKIRADLHIHSCLSPCGSLEMSPSVIVSRAVEAGLGLIALTDHNCALNCPTLEKICAGRTDIHCLYGMEITSTEEVHLLALFDDCAAAIDFSGYIYDRLPDIQNDPAAFGDQVYVDEEENILGEVDRYLGNAVCMTIDEIEEQTHLRNGIFIPAHIDRALFSMTSQLGFLPDGTYDAVELSRHFMKKKGDIASINPHNYPVITNSDAHYPDGVGSAGTLLQLDSFSLEEISSALRNRRSTPFF